ncbi:hypothetical protein LG047_12280 [Methylocystis sp. WRRC1]|nr:hypothetical protein [Methylocystis sp. WRRC1]
MRQAFAKVGVIVEFSPRTREGRMMKARLTPEAVARAEEAKRNEPQHLPRLGF